MELVPTETSFIAVAIGKTYLIKDELRSLGFRWSQANKVWYHLGGGTMGDCLCFDRLVIDNPELGIYLRCFELRENGWAEI